MMGGKAVRRPIRGAIAIGLALVVAQFSRLALCDVRLSGLFSDNMVLQRDVPAAVWGWADPEEQVTVSFAGRRLSTTTDAEGCWSVTLDAAAAGGPHEMTVAGKNSLTLKNVLMGDVWVCSGQSNMEWPLSMALNAEQEIARAGHPRIRLFTVRKKLALAPGETVEGQWVECQPETAKSFSGVGYFFGRQLHEELDVPVGLVSSGWGATAAEAWIGREALEGDGDLAPILARLDKDIAENPDFVEKFTEYCHRFFVAHNEHNVKMSEWRRAAAQAEADGNPAPSQPERPAVPGGPGTPTSLYYGMIRPLMRLRVRGVVWYQGESNGTRGYQYRKLFPALIRDWQTNWRQARLPFLFVQLASYGNIYNPPRPPAPPGNTAWWAELREAQSMTAAAVPDTGMAVTIDIGDGQSIHPANKQDVGKRLALIALAKVHGRDVVHSGPVYESMAIEGARVRLRFNETHGGLTAGGDEKLVGFAVAGEDRKFAWANAAVEDDTIVVWADEAAEPVAVRYGWATNAACNLYNAAGLPASPFRTDDWPCISLNNR